jgi:hypothetical protein
MKKKVCTTLDRFKRDRKKIALYGAGHVGHIYLSLFNAHPFFEFVIDDSLSRHGMSMPGSNLIIKESTALYDENIAVCLTSMSMENEKAIIQNHPKFISDGGQFHSISSCSERFLLS